MLSAKRIANNLKARLPQLWATFTSATERPLLTQDDITDLHLRAQMLIQNISATHDVAHRMSGEQRTLFRGSGMDYDDSRPYQAGDDPRYMNWRLSAKTGQLYMKVFREEREPGVFIVLDQRQSMRFGTQKRLKVTQGARIATLLAFVAQQHNTAISGVALQHKLNWLNEVYAEQDVFNLVQAFSQPCPPVISPATEYSFPKLLRELDSLLVKGSQVYLISDFNDIHAEHRSILLQLASAHQVNAIQVFDPSETDLPAIGVLNFYDKDTAHTTTLDTSASAIHNKYQQMADDYFDAHKNRFTTAGINYLRVATPTDDLVNELSKLHYGNK